MGLLSQYRTMGIVISQRDAYDILRLYFGSPMPPIRAIDDNDRRFAQALVVEAAEATAQIGMLEALWRTASSPTVKPMGVLKTAAKSVLKYLNRPTSVQDAVDSPKYEMVMNSIAYKCRSIWAIRIQTDDSSMLL